MQVFNSALSWKDERVSAVFGVKEKSQYRLLFSISIIGVLCFITRQKLACNFDHSSIVSEAIPSDEDFCHTSRCRLEETSTISRIWLGVREHYIRQSSINRFSLRKRTIEKIQRRSIVLVGGWECVRCKNKSSIREKHNVSFQIALLIHSSCVRLKLPLPTEIILKTIDSHHTTILQYHAAIL